MKVYFDLAQSTTSWPTAWAGLLTKTPSTVQTYMIETVPVLQKIPWDDAERKRQRTFKAYLPNMLNTDGKQESPELESDKDEAPTKKLKTSKEEEDDQEQQPTTVVQLRSLNNFAEDGGAELMMMDDSYDASLLQIHGIDATFINILQCKLQSLVWNAYSQHLRCGNDGEPSLASKVGIDLAKKGTDAIIVSKDLAKEKDFGLMMAGAVSLFTQMAPQEKITILFAACLV